MSDVVIHYHRPPDRRTVFRQQLVHRDANCAVTLMPSTPLAAPVLAADRVILEPGAPVVWFTFDGAWHDIGRFHTAAGEFTGSYANILTPVRFHSPLEWETTDLCLDVFLDAGGTVHLLDEAELDEALEHGWIDSRLADRAREEAASLIAAARAGDWPPRVVREWPLARARRAATTGGTPDAGAV